MTAAPAGQGTDAPTATTASMPNDSSVASSPPVDATADGAATTATSSTGGPESTATTAPDESATTPAPGDITQTVPDTPQETLAPVALDQPAVVGGVELAVDDVERIQGEARLPGEIAGPAFAVHVSLTNSGNTALDLSDVAVNLTDASGAIAPPLTAEPAAPFKGSLAAGQSATAIYVFEFADDRPQPVRIDVSSSAGTPVAVFTGTIS